MQSKTLFISAGHSDADPGAVGNGYTEADIVLEFRDLLAAALRARGVEFSRGGGIIVELFFITNPSDLDAYQRWKLQLAEALADLLAEEVSHVH